MGESNLILNSTMLKENRIIQSFDTNYDYFKYSSLVKDDFKIIKKFFPLLNLVILPTIKPKEISITGNLIPYEVLKVCNSERDINQSSINILSIYPSKFDESDIYVIDADGKIDWMEIPQEHQHFRHHANREIICTHHLSGEINGLPKFKKSTAILLSAWKLYIQYARYKETGIWTLKDLKHGYEAIEQLKKVGKYHRK